jgi:hypothetical protein
LEVFRGHSSFIFQSKTKEKKKTIEIYDSKRRLFASSHINMFGKVPIVPIGIIRKLGLVKFCLRVLMEVLGG